MKETGMNKVQQAWDFVAPRGIPTSMMAAKAIFDAAYLIVLEEAVRGNLNAVPVVLSTASIAILESDVRSYVNKKRRKNGKEN